MNETTADTKTALSAPGDSSLTPVTDGQRIVGHAEATLGWRIANADRFLSNVGAHGLGDALNLEHDYLP